MPIKNQLGPRAQKKAERRMDILDAAFEEFVANGYAATRVEDIAARIGITKGAIYFHFETKEILFTEMIGRISVPFTDVKDHLKTLTGPYPERIKAFVHIVYERITTDRKTRELLRFVISEGSRFPQMVDRHHEEFIQPMFSAAGELLAAGVAAGELRPSPVMAIPEITVSPALLLSFWFMLFDDRKPRDVAGFIDAHIDLILCGMLPRS
jgi:AcrR family transcriptional regulator